VLDTFAGLGVQPVTIPCARTIYSRRSDDADCRACCNHPGGSRREPRARSADLRAALGNWLAPNTQSYELTVVRTLARVPLASVESLRVTASPVDHDVDQTHWQYGVQDRRENLRDGA
jgi:hypothetical protein